MLIPFGFGKKKGVTSHSFYYIKNSEPDSWRPFSSRIPPNPNSPNSIHFRGPWPDINPILAGSKTKEGSIKVLFF